jgi:omega-hydroxy-beta-dihydromenaquinone-9 sulfotransferase
VWDLVFIAGSSRSGTTMLGHALDRHAEVHTLDELHFFEELWDPLDGADELDVPARRALAATLLHRARRGYLVPQRSFDDGRGIEQVAAPAGTAIDVFVRTLRHEAAQHGARVAVEQTPRNALAIEQILEHIPTARVVSLVRDPRDVVLSHKNWWKRSRLGSTRIPRRTTLRRFAQYHPAIGALVWRTAVRACDRVEDPRHLHVRFEELVQDPEVQLRAICEHIGIEFVTDMLEVSLASSSNRADVVDRRGIDPSVCGRWRTGLSASECWLVEHLTGPEMQTHGYERSGWRPRWDLLLVLAALPVKAGLGFVLNLGRTQHPIRSVVARLR